METEFVIVVSAVRVIILSLHCVTIFCGNQVDIAYIRMISNIIIKFIRDIVQQNKVILKFISIHQIVAYPLTKSVVQDVYSTRIRVMRLHS